MRNSKIEIRYTNGKLVYFDNLKNVSQAVAFMIEGFTTARELNLIEGNDPMKYAATIVENGKPRTRVEMDENGIPSTIMLSQEPTIEDLMRFINNFTSDQFESLIGYLNHSAHMKAKWEEILSKERTRTGSQAFLEFYNEFGTENRMRFNDWLSELYI